MVVPASTPIYELPETWCAVVYGPKGAGKSTSAYGIKKATYKVAIIDFDGNSSQTVKSNIMPDKQVNFRTWNVKSLVNFKDLVDTQILVEADKVITIMEDQFYDEIEEFAPDIIIADGYQRFTWLSEMAMRHQQRKRDIKNNSDFVTGAFTGVKNRNAWKERNWILDRFYEFSMQTARVGFIVTVHEKERKKDSEDDEFAGFEPNWSGALKEEAQVVIRQYMSVAGNQNLRWAKVESNKLTGHCIVDLDITGQPYKVWDWIFGQEPQYLL